MQKSILYMIMLWVVSFSLTGCEEIQPEKYSAPRGVNFRSWGANGWDDEVEGLKTAYNFGANFKEWNPQQDTITLSMKLEGLTDEQPIRVRFKSEKVDDFELPEMVYADDYVFEPGENTAVFQVIVKHPQQRDSTYKVNVTVDYAASDVVAGTKERQKFLLEIKDEMSLEMVKITRSDWDETLSYFFGPYSETRLRFVAYALETTDFRMMAWYWPSDEECEQVVNKLKEYNDAHPGNPLLDDDGTPVDFDY